MEQKNLQDVGRWKHYTYFQFEKREKSQENHIAGWVCSQKYNSSKSETKSGSKGFTYHWWVPETKKPNNI